RFMKQIIPKVSILAAIALLWSSCKVLDSAFDGATSSKTSKTLYPYVKDQRVGFVDQNLAEHISPEFQLQTNQSWPYTFSNGLATVYMLGAGGYINKEGNIAIKPQFEEVYSFQEGLALVKSNGQYGYISKKGSFVISPQFADRSEERRVGNVVR